MSATVPSLVPLPRRVVPSGGVPVELSDPLSIAATPELRAEARWFRGVIAESTGWAVDVVGPSDPAAIVLEAGAVPTDGTPGAYRLVAADGRVVVRGDGPSGVFYGLQTLRQLLPDALLRRAPAAGHGTPTGPSVAVPPVVVEDAPRFGWRGVHLDVSRHFMPTSFVLKLVDLAAFHKCNVVHLHLTDDQGWRVPIDRYPRLVEIGAWRRQSPAGHARERRFDGVPHGGFYTKDDLREIVAFAAARHVTIVPEVDMPGHVLAALAAYPELGNGATRRQVGTRWGVYSQILNLEESTLRFCADVIDEVTALFPGPFFHLGGDECPTVEWQRSPEAGALMRAQGYQSARQLQGWFVGRIGNHLARRGRRVVGWDEILDGGAPAEAVVMSWRGMKGGVKAAAAGHDVVMAPEEWLYFDWAHADDEAEPLAIRAATPVEKVYGFDPVPAAIPEERRHHVLGAQCALWTEYVKTPARAEYQYFPRLCAFAETVWSPPSATGSGGPSRTFPAFESRLEHHLRRLDALDVNYRPLDGPTPGQARTWLPPGEGDTARGYRAAPGRG